MITTILAAIAALPKIFEALVKIGQWVQSENYAKWQSELEVATKKLETAKSIQDQLAATRELQRLISGMR